MKFHSKMDLEVPVREEATPPEEPPGDVNILLVDDDARNLDVLESILDLPGYHLIRARSADEALEALMAESFALMVLDVRMPDMNGLELAQLIKRRKKTQRLPIIFLTAYYREDEHVIQGYDAGGVDYLSKPCNPAVLRSKVAAFVHLYQVNRALQEEIAERKQAEQRVAERTAEVHQMVRQLRALASELTQAEQRERKRLARVLHDHIQQLLVSAQMQLSRIRRNPFGEQQVVEIVQDIEVILREALEASRSLTVELSPPVLQESGLGAALGWLSHRLAAKHGFQVTVQADADAEPASEEERFLLFECARELLFNAIKHSHTDKAIVVLSRQEDARVRLVISDAGAGFDLEEMRNRNREQVAYGLFSIQQRLMHLGGTMLIEAAPGAGVRVTLIAGSTEPVAQEQDRSPVAAGDGECTQARVGSKIRVLLVDDHKIMRQGLARLLRTEPDLDVVGEASDGPQALELAEKLRPDVIIMDINLGAISGLHVTRTVLKRNPGIKVIGLSMHREEEAASPMLKAGACAYLTKGGDVEDVISAIRASCASKEPAVADGSPGRVHLGQPAKSRLRRSNVVTAPIQSRMHKNEKPAPHTSD